MGIKHVFCSYSPTTGLWEGEESNNISNSSYCDDGVSGLCIWYITHFIIWKKEKQHMHNILLQYADVLNCLVFLRLSFTYCTW